MSTIKGEMVSIQYNFLFSKESNLWNNIYAFEQDLADFFAANGLECETVTTVSGSTGGRILLLKKMEMATAEKGLVNTKGVNIQKTLPEGSSQKSAQIVRKLTSTMTRQFQERKKKK